jgi:hypothetical protein
VKAPSDNSHATTDTIATSEEGPQVTEVTLYRITRPHYGGRPDCVTKANTGGKRQASVNKDPAEHVVASREKAAANNTCAEAKIAASGEEQMRRVRRLCAALPQTNESLSRIFPGPDRGSSMTKSRENLTPPTVDFESGPTRYALLPSPMCSIQQIAGGVRGRRLIASRLRNLRAACRNN